MQAAAEGAKFLNQSLKPTKTHYTILGMAWAGWLFDFYDLMLFSFLAVPIERDLHVGDASLSLIMGASLAATAAGGILFGCLADRFGRKAVLSWTILIYSIGAFLCGMAAGIRSLLAFRVLTGLGVGGEWAAGQTLVGETFPAATRARYAAVMQTGAPLGIALASVVGGFVEPAFARFLGASAWRGCFVVSVLPALLVVVIRRFLPESDVWLSGHRRRSQFRLLWEPRIRRLFALSLVLAVSGMSAYWFTYTWLPKYLYDKLGFSMARSALWMIATQTGGFAGYLSYGLLADRRGRRPAYASFAVVWAVGLLGITWFWKAIAVWPGLTLVFSFLVGIGTGNFSGYGPIFSELFPTGVRNTAMGMAFNLARGVQFFTPLAITVVAGRYGLGGGISLAALFALFGGAWIWTLPETRGAKIF